MATKQTQMTSLFDAFIRDSERGKRLKSNGKRIKLQTVENYRYVILLMREYETLRGIKLYVREVTGRNKKEVEADHKYWKRFHQDFTRFLYRDKQCFDNYVGGILKIMRTFFGYLKKEKFMKISDGYKCLYVIKEEIPIHTLLPEQLRFLIGDIDFENSLSESLKNSKDIFVFGCTIALRFSDLFSIKPTDVEKVGNSYYLSAKSEKTETPTKVKLPDYAVKILMTYNSSKKRQTIFPTISMNQFNKNVKAIAERAGWTHEVVKTRSRRGQTVIIKKEKSVYRFCDHLSSHTMRRTAITTMLMLGMPEYIVKKVSGHSDNSKSFYRYVSFVQSYLDVHTDKVFNGLMASA